MKQFKASSHDWQWLKKLAESSGINHFRTILELRDRVAALEAERTPEESPAAASSQWVSDQELWEVQWRARTLAQPEVPWIRWSCNDDFRSAHIASNRALYDCGYADGLEAGRAEQQATTELPTDYDYDAPQTLHTVALGMVDTLRRRIGVTDHICDTIERAIREPMAEQQAATEPTPEPEPSPSPADGWLIAALEGIGLDDKTACFTLLLVARWLSRKNYDDSAAELEREANR